METSIYKYILKHSLKEQLLILVVTVLSMPLIYYSLEIPKRIINQAIAGNLPSFSFLGVDLDQISFLLALCCAYLALTVINGGIKYHLNVYRGVLSERLLRRLRYDLYSRILRFPIPYFKKISKSEVVPIITAETEPLGGFFSEAYALPAFQGGLLLTYLFFIFNQNIFLGLAATAIYPLQIYAIPKLQKKVNELARRRVLSARSLASRIGEAFTGAVEIRSLDTSKYERAEITDRLGSLFEIRKEIYKRKYFIKFLNNFLNQITPFFFYLIGGYFVIEGKLSLGALIAVLAAYKDLAGPWKELLKYYQVKEDIRVKYFQIINQFQPVGILNDSIIDSDFVTDKPLSGLLQSNALSYEDDHGVKLLNGVSFQLSVAQHVAIVGTSGSGKEELTDLVAGLLNPTQGQLKLHGNNIAELPVAFSSRYISYAGPGAYLFSGTVLENIYYGLKNQPLPDIVSEKADHTRLETERTGNSPYDFHQNWINLDAAGVNSEFALEEKAIKLLTVVGLEDDIYELGLRSKLIQNPNRNLEEELLQIRQQLGRELSNHELNHLIEPFDYNRYNTNATVAENLLFGIPRDSSTTIHELMSQAYVVKTLQQSGLLDELVQIGRYVAETMVELFSDLPSGHEFFSRFSFISSDDLPMYKLMLDRIDVDGIDMISQSERDRLISVALQLKPAQHRLDVMDDDLQQRLLSVRYSLADGMPTALSDLIEVFNEGRYNRESSVRENILFGKLVYGQANAEERTGELIHSVILKHGLYYDIMRLGLNYDVGVGGTTIPVEQRQKIALARALIKETDLLVVNDAIGVLDIDTQQRIIRAVKQLRTNRGIVWALGQESLAVNFDQILALQKGRIVTQLTNRE